MDGNLARLSGPIFENSNRLLYAWEAAVLLRVSESTIYKMAAEMRLPSVRVGRSVRFRPEDIAAVWKGLRNL